MPSSIHRLYRVFCGLAAIVAFAFVWDYLPARWLSDIAAINHVVTTLALASLIASSVVFLTALFRAKRSAKDHGISGYGWSNAYTVLTLFVPVLNFYRPWVGFGEIYESIRVAAYTGYRGTVWHGSGIGTSTIGLAVVFVGASLGTQGLAEAVKRFDETKIVDSAAFATRAELATAINGGFLALYMVSALAAVLYLRGLSRNLAVVEHATPR